MSENEKLILYFIGEQVNVKTTELAEKLRISRQAITKLIAGLKKKKLLERIGHDKGDHWKILLPK